MALAPARTTMGVFALKQPRCASGECIVLRNRNVFSFPVVQDFTRLVPATPAAAGRISHLSCKSARGIAASGEGNHESTRSSGITRVDDDTGSGGDGSSHDSGGRGGSGSGGASGSPGGSPGDMPLFRPTAAHFLAIIVSYVGCLVGVAAAWGAIVDARSPRLITSNATVSVIIPALNEARIIADTVRHVRQDLDPPPDEVIVVDGGSTDGTAEAASQAGAVVLRSEGRGRGLQMNVGAAAARGELLLFLHADTGLPSDAITQLRDALSSPRTVLVGFRPLIEDQGKTLWFSSLNNLCKTWYGPILLRPVSYIRGLRVLFGDQALCCRAADLRSVGGYRGDIPFMEDAELCIALHMAGPANKSVHQGRGRVRMLMQRPAITSGRRIAAWGEARANLVFAYISLLWLAGASPEQLHSTYRRLYKDVR